MMNRNTLTLTFSIPNIIAEVTVGDIVGCPITMENKAIGFVEKFNKKTGSCEGRIYAALAPEFFDMGNGKVSITGLEMLTK